MRRTSKQVARELYQAKFGCPVPVDSWTEEKIRHCIACNMARVAMTGKSKATVEYIAKVGVAPAASWTAAKITANTATGKLPNGRKSASTVGGKTVAELRKLATLYSIVGRSKMNKAELIKAIETHDSVQRVAA